LDIRIYLASYYDIKNQMNLQIDINKIAHYTIQL